MPIGSSSNREKQFADPTAELPLDDLFLNLVDGNRIHVVLQSFQFRDVRRRKQIGTRRKDLPELDVRRSQLNESSAKRGRFLWRTAVVFARLGLVFDALKPLLFCKLRETISREQADGRREPRDVSWCENHAG